MMPVDILLALAMCAAVLAAAILTEVKDKR
mgnify:CR=1 FL=1